MFYAACMAARAHSADPRAERVRARLRDAAFALAHERPVDQLTVGEIVSRAGVSRQVFYQHFADRDDAVATAFTVAFAAAVTDIDGDPSARIIRLFDFAAEHRAMYRNVVPSAVMQRVVTAFRAELAPACESHRRPGHAGGRRHRRTDAGLGHPIPGRRVRGGAAVLDGGPGSGQTCAAG